MTRKGREFQTTHDGEYADPLSSPRTRAPRPTWYRDRRALVTADADAHTVLPRASSRLVGCLGGAGVLASVDGGFGAPLLAESLQGAEDDWGEVERGAQD